MNQLFALVKDGAVLIGPTALPATFTTEDGQRISGFSKLDVVAVKAHGWLPAIVASTDIGHSRGDPVVTDNDVTYPAVPLPLETVKAELLREVYAAAKRVLDAAVEDYSPGEMAMWPKLEDEASQYNADGTVGPLMQAEISAGGKAAAHLAATITAKGSALQALRASVVANRDRHTAQIAALSVHADAVAYDLNSGWPAL